MKNNCSAYLIVMFVAIFSHMPLSQVCPQFGVPVMGEGYDSDWNEYVLDAAAIQAVLNIDAARSFWVGYEQGGFAWTNDVEPALTLTLYMDDGDERWLDVFWSEQTPEAYYALPFFNTDAYADSNNEHFGTHPCAAVLMTADEYQAFIVALRGE